MLTQDANVRHDAQASLAEQALANVHKYAQTQLIRRDSPRALNCDPSHPPW